MKVDCHRHLGGSLGADFVWSVVQSRGLHYLGENYEEIKAAISFTAGEPYGFHRFLNKFSILDILPWDVDLIDESIKHISENIISEGIDYTWLRFSINKYLDHMAWHKFELIQLVYDLFERYAPGRVGLVLSLKYESTRASQRQYAAILDDDKVNDCIAGIDLVGDEAYFDVGFYKPIMDEWHRSGKMVCAHVGESQSAKNVMLAMRDLGICEIAHGVKAAEDLEMLRYAKDNDVCFHMALTSNKLTGTWDETQPHPIRVFLDEGVKVTIGTDDPVQCSTNLIHEYDVARGIGLTRDEIVLLYETAAERVGKYII